MTNKTFLYDCKINGHNYQNTEADKKEAESQAFNHLWSTTPVKTKAFYAVVGLGFGLFIKWLTVKSEAKSLVEKTLVAKSRLDKTDELIQKIQQETAHKKQHTGLSLTDGDTPFSHTRAALKIAENLSQQIPTFQSKHTLSALQNPELFTEITKNHKEEKKSILVEKWKTTKQTMKQDEMQLRNQITEIHNKLVKKLVKHELQKFGSSIKFKTTKVKHAFVKEIVKQVRKELKAEVRDNLWCVHDKRGIPISHITSLPLLHTYLEALQKKHPENILPNFQYDTTQVDKQFKTAFERANTDRSSVYRPGQDYPTYGEMQEKIQDLLSQKDQSIYHDYESIFPHDQIVWNDALNTTVPKNEFEERPLLTDFTRVFSISASKAFNFDHTSDDYFMVSPQIEKNFNKSKLKKEGEIDQEQDKATREELENNLKIQEKKFHFDKVSLTLNKIEENLESVQKEYNLTDEQKVQLLLIEQASLGASADLSIFYTHAFVPTATLGDPNYARSRQIIKDKEGNLAKIQYIYTVENRFNYKPLENDPLPLADYSYGYTVTFGLEDPENPKSQFVLTEGATYVEGSLKHNLLSEDSKGTENFFKLSSISITPINFKENHDFDGDNNPPRLDGEGSSSGYYTS